MSELTIKIELLNLEPIKSLVILAERMHHALKEFESFAGDSVEYGDWPELQAHVRVSEGLREQLANFAEPAIPDVE